MYVPIVNVIMVMLVDSAFNSIRIVLLRIVVVVLLPIKIIFKAN